jgi:hypothetical protein
MSDDQMYLSIKWTMKTLNSETISRDQEKMVMAPVKTLSVQLFWFFSAAIYLIFWYVLSIPSVEEWIFQRVREYDPTYLGGCESTLAIDIGISLFFLMLALVYLMAKLTNYNRPRTCLKPLSLTLLWVLYMVYFLICCGIVFNTIPGTWLGDLIQGAAEDIGGFSWRSRTLPALSFLALIMNVGFTFLTLKFAFRLRAPSSSRNK